MLNKFKEMDIDKRNNILTAVLAVVIIFLGWLLYDSITGPYQDVLEAREVRDQTRQRMTNIRDAMIIYDRRFNEFPEDLDQLVEFLKTDSTMVADGDSLFRERPPLEYDPDQIIFSPRTGNRFEYTLNDTLRPNIYLLEDPDSDDHIGDLERTTLLNATSWN